MEEGSLRPLLLSILATCKNKTQLVVPPGQSLVSLEGNEMSRAQTRKGHF